MNVATFSSVTQQHVLQAIEEYDARGTDDFLQGYGFEATPGYRLSQDGRDYDARAVLGVAHRYATGRLATPEDFHGGMGDAVSILRRRGFQVSEPASARRAAPARTAPSRAPRSRAATSTRPTSRRATDPPPPVICPTCSTALPATGVCDYCA